MTQPIRPAIPLLPPKHRCAMTGCGQSAELDGPRSENWSRVKDHPCYSEDAHHYFARMHVAVAPACNIQCNYCNRKYDCSNENRPGVVSERLTPEQAVRKTKMVAAALPELSVLGIAGPGDACFDWKKTRSTFENVSEAIPDLKLCLSTNGLSLPEHVDEIVALGIDHVTITINMVDPEIGAKIYPWIYHAGDRHTGVAASRILHERQMLGLEMLVARKVLVKINSVMIPGINDEHLVEVNRVVMAKGAFLHNIMPLISNPAHGTHFGLIGQRGPTPRELAALQGRLGGGGRLMRHCRQCRADAIGLLGEDRGQEFTMARLAEEPPTQDPARRALYRDVVAAERGEHATQKDAAEQRVASMDRAPSVQVAVATKGGGRINQHFGHAREFLVFTVSAVGVRFQGVRKVDHYCLDGAGDEEALKGAISALEGVSAVLCTKIGRCPREALEAAGMEVSQAEAQEWIEAGVASWYEGRYGTAVQRRA